MKTRIALAAAAASIVPLALCACPPRPNYPPEPDVVVFPPYDADPEAADEELDGRKKPAACDVSIPADCRLACESMAKIGCPESAPAGDRTCGCVCAHAEAAGLPMKTICVANASTPDQMRACNVRCAGR